MANRIIDFDRGVQIQRQNLDNGGMYIYMYIDTPGVYLNAHGKEVPEALAREVGFDVDKHRKARIKREKMSEYMNQVEAELEMLSEAGEEVVLHELGGYKVVQINEDSANVFTTEGDKLNSVALPISKAVALLEKLTGGKVEAKVEDEDAKEENPTPNTKGTKS